MRFFSTVLMCLWLAGLSAQSVFKKRFGTSGNDDAVDMVVLPDGSFITAGGTTGGGIGGVDALLVKFSSAGAVDWSRAYGGSGTDFFTHLDVCSDGNVLVIGETTSFGAGGVDIYIVKINPASGDVIWERTAGGANAEASRGLCEVSDGYIITGGTQSFGFGFWDIYVVKLDLNGAHVWNRALGGGGGDIGGGCMPAANGDVWVTGFTFVSSGNHDAFLYRFDANGALTLSRRITAANNDGYGTIVPGGPGFLCSGGTWSFGANNQYACWMSGFDDSGNLLWTRRYPIAAGSYDMMITPTPDGGVIFAPTRSVDEANGLLVKTDASGNVVWSKSYSLEGSGRFYKAAPAPGGGYYVIGYTTGAGRDIFVMRTDATGNLTNDCCPPEGNVQAVTVSPGSIAVSPNNVSGPATASPAGQVASPGLTETNICVGPVCCVTDAGSIGPASVILCAPLDANFTHNGDEVLDNNDLLQFVAFTSIFDPLGSIVAVSNTPVFAFAPPLTSGVNYFVMAIAGNNVGGNVDFNDPCFDISNVVQLVWRPQPTVTMTHQNNVCSSGCQMLDLVFQGTPPFIFTWKVIAPNGQEQTFSQVFNVTTASIEVCPPPGMGPGLIRVQAVSLYDAICVCD